MDNPLALICLAAGGLIVTAQVFAAIVGMGVAAELRQMKKGALIEAKILAAGICLAIPFLALGAWLSANPFTAVGKTILLGAAVGSSGLIFLGWAKKDIEAKSGPIDLLPGMINLAIVGGAGLVLTIHGMR
ncbi:MAG TPA: hypothetical protein VFZ35_08170 [Sphingomicrobium sp.]